MDIDPGDIASRLVDLSFKAGSTDNITALIVCFLPGNDYVESNITATRNGRYHSSIDDNNNQCMFEFIPGPFNKYSHVTEFYDAYLAYAKRHGFVPQFQKKKLIAFASMDGKRQEVSVDDDDNWKARTAKRRRVERQ